MSSESRGLTAWGPAVALWGAPVVALALLLVVALRLDADALRVAAPETVEVTERVRDLRSSVTAEIDLGAEQVARLGRGGTVTEVGVAPGVALTDGAVVARVDGVVVFAYRGATPLYRPLRVGDRGGDVGELHAYLGRLGLAHLEGEVYTAATARAVGDLQALAGIRPDGAFAPELVTFVPPTAGAVRAVAIQVGDAVAPGAEVARFDRPLAAVRLRAADERRSLAVFGDAPVRLSAGDRELDLDSITAIDPAAFADFLDGAPGVTVADDGDRRTVSGLLVALRDPDRVGAVPAQALLAAGGRVCVVVETDGAREVVPIDAAATASTEIGVALVPAALIGRRVVLDPTAVPAALADRCV